MNIRTFGSPILSSVDGPHERVVLHTAGCNHRCPGCFNQATWDPYGINTQSDPVQTLAAELLKLSKHLTISGGEPLNQPDALHALVRAYKDEGQTVILYTGYSLSEALRRAHWLDKGLVDAVIAGPYIQSKPDAVRLCGSTNQEIKLFTSVFTEKQFETHDVQFVFDQDTGKLTILGFPTKEDLDLIRG